MGRVHVYGEPTAGISEIINTYKESSPLVADPFFDGPREHAPRSRRATLNVLDYGSSLDVDSAPTDPFDFRNADVHMVVYDCTNNESIRNCTLNG